MTNISQNWIDNLGFLIPFTSNYSLEITASGLASKIKTPQKTVSRYCNLLVELQMLHYRRDGRNKLFSVPKTSKGIQLIKLVEQYKSLMCLIQFPIISQIVEDLGLRYDLILFGSYAKGDAKKDSDIDMVLIGKKNDKLINKYPRLHAQFVAQNAIRTLIKKPNTLMREIIKDHVLLTSPSMFVDVIFNE